ncbi:hypothetical protein ScPMuIL_012548 [Solemya velum]
MFLFSVFTGYYDYVMLTVRHISQEKIPSIIAHEKANHSMKTIYLHTSPFYWNSINFDGCEETRCKLITKPDSFNSSDCVVFHFKVNMDNKNIPPKPRGQVWVFYAREAPPRTLTYPHWHNLVNWTFTLRRDSDFLMPYGRLFQRPKPVSLDFSKIIQRKTKGVAAMIGNCHTESLRDRYINLLKQYREVDVYGGCGIGRVSKSKRHSLLNETYKYYLSFENSLCRDYISEKAFDMYSFVTVPIVRGGALYDLYFPPGSYINANDFSTVKELADHLKFLDSNPEAYSSYFKSRNYIGSKLFTKNKLSENNILCDLCKRLHNPKKYVRVYNNFQTWWNSENLVKLHPSKFDAAWKNYTVHCKPPTDLE